MTPRGGQSRNPREPTQRKCSYPSAHLRPYYRGVTILRFLRSFLPWYTIGDCGVDVEPGEGTSEGRRSQDAARRGYIRMLFIPFWGQPFPLSFSSIGAEIRSNSLRAQNRNGSDIRDLLFEPSPKLSPKFWVVAARCANPRPWDEVLRCTT